MQDCSDEYKVQIKKEFRNLAYMSVTVGVINQEAQDNIALDTGIEYEYFSNLVNPLKNYDVEVAYATAEQGFSKVDDSMCFLPEKDSIDVLFNQGIVSNSNIRFTFGNTFDIKGLTVDFSHVYPVDFNIVTDSGTFEVRGNKEQLYIIDHVFLGTTFIEFVPITMLTGEARLRIYKIITGMGVYFDNHKILSSTKKEHLSPIMEDLQTLDFSLKVDNKDRAYDVENYKSSINFMEIGQDVTVRYGYKLDDESVEWFDGCKLKLSKWSANDTAMTLNATDLFDTLDDTYYNGVYSKNGISLYELAFDVFADAGVTSDNYWIDPYLKKIMVNNPMPAVEHKEALQLIANAGRCILYQDRQGIIKIRSDFVPDMTASSATTQMRYSKVHNILNSDEKDHYVQATQDYTRVDDSMYFLPTDIDYLNTGYISGLVSNDQGTFTANPTVTISMENGFIFYGLTLKFHEIAPKLVKMHCYFEDNLMGVVELTDLNIVTRYIKQLPYMDKMVIEFVKTSPNTRIVLDEVIFGDVTDYKFSYKQELKDYPVGTQLTKVKDLNVIRTVYTPDHEGYKELITETVIQTSGTVTYSFYPSNPSYGYVASIKNKAQGQSITIAKSSCHRVVVEITGSGTMEVVIKGYEYLTTNQIVSLNINPTGNASKWENPLISDISHATDVGEWVKGYVSSDREYSLKDRGEPRLDCADIAFLENRYVDDMLIKLTDYSLTFNGAFCGSAKARRYLDVDST